MLVYKDGITRTIDNGEWQHFKSMGFVKVEEKAHVPEPMEIEEKEPMEIEEKPEKADKTKQDKKGD